MSFESLVRDYLTSMHEYIDAAAATREVTPELSYRPVLDTFLRKISRLYCPDADIIFEPKLQGHAGRPDWRIYNNADFGLYGFVEAKGLDPRNPINIEPHREQISRYLGTGQRVILTDGIEFIFFEPGRIDTAQRHCIVPKPIRHRLSRTIPIDFLIDNLLRDFFRETGFRQCSEEQLIREIAKRASALAECVLILSQAPPDSGVSEDENRTIRILHDLHGALRLQHDPVLRQPKIFADFVAQVLCFGLLYAHRVVAGEAGEPPSRYEAIRRFWTDAVFASYADRLVPFKALVGMLESELSPEGESASQLRCWYDDARRLLAHIQLRLAQRSAPDYHTLYEQFLAEFDPKTRFDFGAFYTPPELAGFTVGAAKSVAESTFGGRCLFEEGNKIIDPCCGTGTFLEQLVRHSSGGNAAHLVGFEILPAPYALAHYRIAMLRIESVPEHDIDIFLTNSLSDELIDGDDDHPASVLREELRRAKNCAQPPIVLVIGNPPSSDSFGPHSTGENFTVIERLLEDFRPPEGERRSRQNIQKQIGNDFMKFLRWAADKVLESDMGILALILPSTFAAHPTYRYAREWLIGHFSHFWAMDIDRDLRTGVRSSSLFNSRQGRMLLIATHTGSVPDTLAERLHYIAITDKTRTQKKSFLDESRSSGDYIALFSQYDLNRETKAFRFGEQSYDRDLYSRFWAIHSTGPGVPAEGERCIFERHCSGIKLAPVALFVHPSRPLLQRRSQEVGNLATPYANLIERWFSGQKKPPGENKLTQEVRQRLGAASIAETSYRKYSFRPFVPMHLLFEDSLLRVLSGLGGGGTRLRPEVVSAYSSLGTVGIAIAPSPIDIGDDIHRFATFCWDMPDNDLCARGNAHVFCNQFPENKPPGGRAWDPTPKTNISECLLAAVRAVRPETTARDIVFYSYAVLCSGTLLEAFAEAYYTASDRENIPRIPIVSDPDIIAALIGKGQRIAELENPETEVQLQAWAVRLESAYSREFKLVKFSVDDERHEIRLFSDIQREPEITLEGIPEELLQITISGYEVINCWLKFHTYAYTRTAFTSAEFCELLRLLSVLMSQIDVISDVDAVIEKVISREVELL
jgi:hypothetical protein